MQISAEWINEYLEKKYSKEAIASILTYGGLETEITQNGLLDGEVTANRPDWLSAYGLAREIAALTGTKLLPLNISPIENINNLPITLNITDESLMIRYSAYSIKNITVKESPEWLKKRLTEAGIRPIANVIDITNYIMIDTGQPLHAFDLDLLGKEMTIRYGKKGEKIKTLDNVERDINEQVIVGESNKKLVDLMGIMGGLLSETSTKTKNILLQGAVFPPALIRKSSKLTKISTEASYRYERGVDYEQNINYLNKAANMIVELCGGEITGFLDTINKKSKPESINWDLSQAQKLLGVPISEKDALTWLNSLGIKTTKDNNIFKSISPSWRFDVTIKEDIFEELVRFYPVDKLPRTKLPASTVKKTATKYSIIEHIKDELVAIGLTEIDGYSFISGKILNNAKIPTEICLEASNPLSEEYQYLRPTLFPDMLMAVAQNPSYNPIAFFEIGDVFSKKGEKTNLGIIIASNVEVPEFINDVNNWLSKNKIEIKLKKIDKQILNDFKIRKACVQFLEIDFSQIKKEESTFLIPKMDQNFRNISKFPSVRRDLAIIVDNSINAMDIANAINNFNFESIKTFCELFDEYISPKFGENKKSLAFHITYQPEVKTLNDTEADKIHGQLINLLREKFKAEPRV